MKRTRLKRKGFIKKKWGGKTNNKSSYIKILQKEAEELWKKVCKERDGTECMVQRSYPDLPIVHTPVIQVDHCFTRGNKELFLEPANGTVVCSGCNGNKFWERKSVHRLIDEIVINREGFDKYNQMKQMDHYSKAYDMWRDVNWLEAKVAELKKMLEG